MNVLLDVGAIKSGGGAQLALNFLAYINSHSESDINWFAVLPPHGVIRNAGAEGIFKEWKASSAQFCQRLYFENVELPNVLCRWGIHRIFTFFGSGLPHPVNIKSVVSVAYPIVCYPESLYWKHVPTLEGMKKRAMNRARLARMKLANTIIVETAIMQKRLAAALGRNYDGIKIIGPTPTAYVQRSPCPEEGITRFLFISGIDQHKNLWRLPAVATSLLRRGRSAFRFVLTVDRGALLDSMKRNRVSACLHDEMFEFVGSVSPMEIDLLYKRSACVVSLSDLESFSNNYMEAWLAGRPLIASDRDFAREICRSSALFVEPHNTEDIADKMVMIMDNHEVRDNLIMSGTRQLQSVLSQNERFSRVMAEVLA